MQLYSLCILVDEEATSSLFPRSRSNSRAKPIMFKFILRKYLPKLITDLGKLTKTSLPYSLDCKARNNSLVSMHLTLNSEQVNKDHSCTETNLYLHNHLSLFHMKLYSPHVSPKAVCLGHQILIEHPSAVSPAKSTNKASVASSVREVLVPRYGTASAGSSSCWVTDTSSSDRNAGRIACLAAPLEPHPSQREGSNKIFPQS